MAKIKFGQIVSEARGKIAGFVFSRNTYGSYARQKVSPINPSSVAQRAVRTYIGNGAQAWKNLTDAQRLQWNTATADWKTTNVFGDAKTLTGFNLFVKCYKTAMDIAQTPLTDYGGSDSPVGIATFTPAITHGPDSMVLNFTPAIPAGERWIVYGTAPHSQGRNFVKSEYRQLAVLSSTDLTGLDIKANYIAVFGAIPTASEACHLKIKPVLKASYHAGAELAKAVK